MEDLQVVEKALSEGAKNRSQLRRTACLRVTVASGAAGTKTWDVFVSHEGHLKDSIVASMKDYFGREHPDVRVFVVSMCSLQAGGVVPA
jgi:hypothetical protein